MASTNPATERELHQLRGRIAALTRAVNNGERPAGDPLLEDCRRRLAEVRLARYIEETVANWPQLTDEQIDRVAGLLRGGRAS